MESISKTDTALTLMMGLEYFETIEEAAKYIVEIIGKVLKLDFAEIENAIDEYMEEHDNSDESWMSFHRFEVLDD